VVDYLSNRLLEPFVLSEFGKFRQKSQLSLDALKNADVVQSNNLIDDFHVSTEVNNIVDDIRNNLFCKDSQ
jgi:hypothetical protein